MKTANNNFCAVAQRIELSKFGRMPNGRGEIGNWISCCFT